MASVLFVCTGNICRSPTAHGVFAQMVAARGLGDCIRVDSAGTHDYHPGKAPDPRTVRAAARRGYDLRPLRAREVRDGDFAAFDYVLAMDRDNHQNLLRRCPPAWQPRVRMFLEFAPHLGQVEVPDPHYGDGAGFELVLDLVEDGSAALLEHIAGQLPR